MRRPLLCALLLLPVTGCGSPTHPAVGNWHATNRNLPLHLLENGTGSFDSRNCTWQEIDATSVLTDCERLLLGRVARKFTVTETNGREIGTLETYQGVQFVRAAPSSQQAPPAEDPVLTAEETGDMPPTWIGNNEATQALGGQVLIAAFGTSEQGATLRVTLPDTSVIAIDNMRSGTRRLINIEGVNFYLDLLDAGPVMGAQVSLTRKR